MLWLLTITLCILVINESKEMTVTDRGQGDYHIEVGAHRVKRVGNRCSNQTLDSVNYSTQTSYFPSFLIYLPLMYFPPSFAPLGSLPSRFFRSLHVFFLFTLFLLSPLFYTILLLCSYRLFFLSADPLLSPSLINFISLSSFN